MECLFSFSIIYPNERKHNMKKNRKSSIFVLCGLIALSLVGCTDTSSNQPSSSSDTTSDTSSPSNSTSVVDSTPTLEVVGPSEVRWGDEDFDATKLFKLTVGDVEKVITSDMITGSIDTKMEGIYSFTCTATVDGVTLTKTATVEVYSKVEITLPHTADPYYSFANSSYDVNIEDMISCFSLSINDQQVTIDPSWISGEVGKEIGASYPVTLTVDVDGRTYEETVNIHIVKGLASIYTNYTEEAPFIIEQGEANIQGFDFTKLFSTNYVSDFGYYYLADKAKASGLDKDDPRIIFADFDKSQIDFDTPGLYPVSVTAHDELDNLITATAYVQVNSNIHIKDNEEARVFFPVNEGTISELYDLFTIDEGGVSVPLTACTLDTSLVKFDEVGDYSVTLTYKGVSYSRTIAVLPTSFFGTYKNYDFLNSGEYLLEYQIRKDGTVQVNWQYEGRVANSTEGKMELTDRGRIHITSSNAYWNYNIDLCYDDAGILYEDVLTSVTGSSSTFLSSLTLMYNEDIYSPKASLNDVTRNGEEIIDIAALTIKATGEDYYVLHRSTYSSYTVSLEGVYLDQEIIYNDDEDTYSTTVVGVAEYIFSLEPQSDGTVDLTKISTESLLPDSDPTGISGEVLSLEGDESKNLTITHSISYDGSDSYSVSGSFLVGESSARIYAINVSKEESVFLVSEFVNDPMEDGTKVNVAQLYEVTVDPSTNTFTVASEEEQDYDGFYIADDYHCYTLAGNYGWVSVNHRSTIGYPIKITREEDPTLLHFDIIGTTGSITYFDVQMGNNYNTLSVLETDYTTLATDFATLYNDVKGIYIQGSEISVPLSDEEYLTSNLFVAKKKDADGNIVEIPASELELSLASIPLNEAKTYSIRAKYIEDGIAYYGQSYVHVLSTPFADIDVAGTYTGYWTYGPNGPCTLIVDSTGKISLQVNNMHYSDFLRPIDDNKYAFTQAGYTGELWFKDEACYAIVRKSSNTAFMVALRAEEEVTYLASTSVSGLDQQALLVGNETDGYHLLTYDYSGEVTLDNIQSGVVSGVTVYLIDTYDLEGNFVAQVQYQTNGSASVCIASDNLIGEYTTDSGEKVTLDGYGNATIDDSDYLYARNDDRLVIYNMEEEYVYTINKEDMSLNSYTEKDAMAGIRLMARIQYSSSSSYTAFTVYLDFDGYGFARLTSPVLQDCAYLTYDASDINSLILSTTHLDDEGHTITKLTSGNYVLGAYDEFKVSETLTFLPLTTFTIAK